MAKGGKGRKGGGGGAGPKQRKYERDNNGRFASTGTGATARGGRLATAKGNKRKTQTITAAGQKGVLAKPKGLKPGAIKPKAAAKPAALSTKAKTPKFTTEQSGRVRRAALGGGRTAIVRKNSAVIINAKGEPIMTRKGLPNITAGKKYAANPNARGPRIMGRDRSEASPSRGYIRTSKPTGTIGKPKGLKPGAIKPKAAAATRKGQLAAGAQRRNAQANRIDAKVKALEGQYRSKDAAFYTQGAKPAGRDRMIAKSQQAAQLREQSAALRTKAANAEKMSQRVKGTAASKKQERRNAFDTAGYKVGDTVTTRQYGTQKITKISKNSVSFEKGNTQDKAFMANYLGLQATSAASKPAAPKPASTAAERIKIKTPIRRAMSTNRASVVTPGQRSRLETGKGAKIKGARLNSSVAKPRTAGNTKPQVASRVKRKLAAENAKMNQIQRRERIGARQGKQYERSLKREMLLERAKTFLESGKLPGKDNSIAAQRNTKQARQRLAAKNAERRTAAAKPAAKVDTSMKGITVRRARALAPRTSTYLSQKLNIQSAITKSAANAIYNRQRTVGKALGLDEAVVRNPIGIMPKISGSIRSRAAQLREAARKRVVGGRRR